MAIPGAIMFTLAGVTGQFILNGLDRWRIEYVFEQENKWNETKPKSKQDISRDKIAEYEHKFGVFERFGLKKTNYEKRIQLLKREIEKVDVMLKKVDDEIAALEKTSKLDAEKGN
jgi:hypothetical protein